MVGFRKKFKNEDCHFSNVLWCFYHSFFYRIPKEVFKHLTKGNSESYNFYADDFFWLSHLTQNCQKKFAFDSELNLECKYLNLRGAKCNPRVVFLRSFNCVMGLLKMTWPVKGQVIYGLAAPSFFGLLGFSFF